jgi:hypothetical protein
MSTTPTTRTIRTTATALVALAALSGCGGGSSDGSAGTPAVSPLPSASSSTLDSVEAERPEPGDCHQMTLADVTASSAAGTSSDCQHRPTAITVAVGRLAVKGKPVAADSPAAQQLMERTCRPKAAAWLGTDPRTLRLSRLTAIWFTPTPAQVDAGAQWFRCDVVGFDRGNHLIGFPAPYDLKGSLRSDKGFARYALCGTAKPGTKGFDRVACSLKHSWKAIATVDLKGGKAYPGTAKVRDEGSSTCRDKANAATDATRYDYGWEWPTAQQWRAGQRYGFCWVPA